MVQENPALIQPLMQQIATSNPQLAQLINQNPQALYDLLGAGAAGEGDDEDGYQGAQVMHVDLTEAEAAAVERVSQATPAGDPPTEQTLINSSKHSDSNDKWFCRPTCSATRTKNWLQTFCLTVEMMRWPRSLFRSCRSDLELRRARENEEAYIWLGGVLREIKRRIV